LLCFHINTTNTRTIQYSLAHQAGSELFSNEQVSWMMVQAPRCDRQ